MLHDKWNCDNGAKGKIPYGYPFFLMQTKRLGASSDLKSVLGTRIVTFFVPRTGRRRGPNERVDLHVRFADLVSVYGLM